CCSVCSSCAFHSRNLPSFPTRRSSDLQSQKRNFQSVAIRFIAWLDPSPWIPGHGPVDFQGRFLLKFLEYLRRDRRTFYSANAARSEEHTSELQSLRHLVCRLLLEKKNK